MPFLAVLADFETFWVKTKRKKSEIVQIFIFYVKSRKNVEKRSRYTASWKHLSRKDPFLYP